MNHPRRIQELLALPEKFDERLQIKTRGYLFHGSPNGDITLLEPRQANHNRKPDGQPAVCASDSVWDSMFKGLYNRQQLVGQVLHNSGWEHTNGILKYYASKNLADAAKTAKAHLYLVDPVQFEWVGLEPDPDHGDRKELRSLAPVKPLARITFNLSDFPHPVEIREPKL